MIVEELIGNDLVKHYSSVGKKIRQSITGNLFNSAVDVYPCPYEYEEVDNNVPQEETAEDKAEAYDILVGTVE